MKLQLLVLLFSCSLSVQELLLDGTVQTDSKHRSVDVVTSDYYIVREKICMRVSNIGSYMGVYMEIPPSDIFFSFRSLEPYYM